MTRATNQHRIDSSSRAWGNERSVLLCAPWNKVLHLGFLCCAPSLSTHIWLEWLTRKYFAGHSDVCGFLLVTFHQLVFCWPATQDTCSFLLITLHHVSWLPCSCVVLLCSFRLWYLVVQMGHKSSTVQATWWKSSGYFCGTHILQLF